MKVHCLHTNPSDCAVYDALFAQTQQQIEVTHAVRVDLLEMAQDGSVKTSREIADELAQAPPGAIALCTCTTLAPFVPISATRLNITRPAMMRAVALGQDVLVVLKSPQLQPVMQADLATIAAEMGMPVRPRFVVCAVATGSDIAKAILAELAQTTRPGSILLAQASMRGAVVELRTVGSPVVATPDCAVAAVCDLLDAA